MTRNKDDYVGVHERVALARAKYQDKLTIRTHYQVLPTVEDQDGDVRTVIVTATVSVTNNDGTVTTLATGTANCETLDAGDNNLEKTETKAVGRALAFAGFAADKGIASAEEMEDVKEETRYSRRTGTRRGRLNQKVENTTEDTTNDYDESEEESDTGSKILLRNSKRRASLQDDTDENEEEVLANPLSKFKSYNRS